ncbi:site-2 protease family protein [Amycolatopsis antarctica]|uniref:Site-2 protease family protein n=1 Tax=Amycolatopsis antarctica TaxID=1854586 RepID=A0A263D5E2_9PSEU|nr:site-2 protease family protein [Amycolatopsis antarctica]OZM73680.1 site-2 protease family protein [Amycolatopsis antarctica]
MQRSAIRPSPLFFGILAVTIAGGVLTVLQAPLPVEEFGGEFMVTAIEHQPLGTLGIVLLVIGGWAASLTLHEFGHAVVAYKGGDHEVAAKGYLTMDIRRYTDPVLSLVLPLLLLAFGGIPLPGGAVWINRWALRSRSTASWVSLAGPLSNLVLGVALTMSVAFIPMAPGLMAGLSYLALLQILAFVLNILPVPGLDGFGAIEPYLSPQVREFGMKARPWAPLVLFALLIGVPFVGDLFFGLADSVFGLLGGDEYQSSVGQTAFMFWR